MSVSRPMPAFVVALLLSTVAAAENWPQWRGPGGQGISSEPGIPTDWQPDRNVLWKVPMAPGHSSPAVWGDRLFVTAAIEGEVLPGRKAVEHTMEGKPWVHPDSVAADRRHTFKVLAIEARTGKTVWEQTAYEGPVYDARHRASSFAGPTPATDGKMVFAYFGPEGLFAYGVDGKLAWKVVEQFPTLGMGAGTSPVLYQNLVIIQRDEDNGERSAIVAYDKGTGKEVWRAKRNVQITLGDAGAGRYRSAGRAGDQRHGVRHRLRPGQRQGALALARRREQCHSHPARRPRPGDRHRRLPREKGHRAAPGRRPRGGARRLGILQGHRLRDLEHPLRRLCLPGHRQRHRHLSRPENRRGRVPRGAECRCRRGSPAHRSRSAATWR